MQSTHRITIQLIALLFIGIILPAELNSETLREKDYIGKDEIKFIKNGTRLYNNGDLEAAFLEFKKATYANPDSSQAAYFLGQAYEKKNNPRSAVMAYSRVLKKQAQGYLVHKYDDYSFLIDKKVKAILKDGALKERLINMYIQNVPWGQSKFEEANKLFKRGWVLHRELGLYNEGIETYLRAILRDVNFADAYKEIGLVYMKKDDYVSAKVFFKRALKIQPNHSLARYDLAICNESLGTSTPDEDIESYQKALLAAPDNIFPLQALGSKYVSAEQYDKAIQLLEKAITNNPEYRSSYSPLLTAYLKTGQYEKAIEISKKALELFPDSINIRLKLAQAYKGSAMYDKAIEEYTGLSKGEYRGGYFAAIGTAGVYVAQGEIGKAVSLLEEKLSPFYPKEICASYGLGMIYMDDEKYEDAAAEFEQVLKIDPKNTAVIRKLEIIYSRYLKDDEQAAHYKQEYEIIFGTEEEQNTRLEENTGGISGTITRGDITTAVAGVEIIASSQANQELGIAITDLDGYYVVRNLPQGLYELNVILRGSENFGIENVKDIAVTKDVITKNVDCSIMKLSSIAGEVIGENRKPVPNVEGEGTVVYDQ